MDHKHLRQSNCMLPRLTSDVPPLFSPEVWGIPASHPWVLDMLDHLNFEEATAEEFQAVIEAAPTDRARQSLWFWYAGRHSVSHLVVKPAQ